MSDPETFIARWSRRKRAALEDAAKPAAVADEAAARAHAVDDEHEERNAPAAQSGAPESAELAFDLAKLPPIESITAESDIRAFLAPGVPAELTRAALRRAWATDPKIRDFVGLADYDWDFNAPGAMTGFGSLEMTDELRRHVEEMVGRSLGGEADRTPPTATAVGAGGAMVETSGASIESPGTTGETPTEQSESKVGVLQDESIKTSDDPYNSNACLEHDKAGIAAQHNLEQPNDVELIAKRVHGRALPK
jgi:hypothetical protein